jgi:hypothetical protein
VTAPAPADTRVALSSDELRALARVAGAVLPPELLEGWHPDDTAVADTVAVRSLLARGLLQLCPGRVALTRAAASALDPLLDARALAGLSLLGGDREERRRLVAESATGTLLLTEREPDVWTLEEIPGPVERAVGWLAADLLEEGLRPEPGGATFAAPAATLHEVDGLAVDRPTDAAAVLAGTGVPPSVAEAWVAVLRGRLATGDVRLTRRLGPGGYAGGGVRWLDAGTAGIWLVSADDDDPDLVRVTDAGVVGVRAALGALLEEDPR